MSAAVSHFPPNAAALPQYSRVGPRHLLLLLEHGHVDGARGRARDVAKAAAARGVREILVALGGVCEGEGVRGVGCGLSGGRADVPRAAAPRVCGLIVVRAYANAAAGFAHLGRDGHLAATGAGEVVGSVGGGGGVGAGVARCAGDADVACATAARGLLGVRG